MTTERVMTDEQLIRQATDILLSRLGLVEATRFFALANRGRTESVERHRVWQETLDQEAFFEEVFSSPKKTWSVPD